MNKNAHYFLIFPWIIYLFVIFLFRVKYVDFNLFVIYPIIISIFLSIIFYFIGLNVGQIKLKKSHIVDEYINPNNEPKYIRLIIFLALLGSIGSIYFDLIDLRSNSLFQDLTSQNSPLFYSLRVSNNFTAELTGSFLKSFFKLLFPICFFFYIYNFTHKYKIYQYSIVLLSLISCLITGGRFYFLYFFLIFVISRKNFDSKFELINFKNIIFFFILFYILISSFSLRSFETYNILYNYKENLGIESILFEDISFGHFENIKNNFLSFIIYSTHSLYFYYIHYVTFEFQQYSNGGYTFNLLYRIINTIFNTEFITITNYFGTDPTIGRYSTFARDLIADFGLIGLYIFYSFYAFVFGIANSLKRKYSSFKILYYWLALFFILSPHLNVISSGFINLMFLYSFIFLFLEVSRDTRYDKS